MEIRALDLENVKSYERERIAFARGTNAICGPNGAGKSTIIEAIGFALFNQPPSRRIGDWVREGEKTAVVTLSLLADDEREYQVVRKCGAQNQYYVYDPELRQRLAIGADDVRAWLREQLGVDESVDLAALFRDAVGVPQGLLTAAFLQTAKNRQTVFDPLLRVEEYNQAFANLLEPKRALDGHVQAVERDIAGFQAEVKSLPDLEVELAGLTQEIAAAEAQLAELAPRLASLAAEKQALEAARDRLRELTERAARLDERLSSLTVRVEQAQQAVAQAEAASHIVAESEPGWQAFRAAQKRRQALEAQERARAQAQQAVSQRRMEQQLAADRIGRLEQELEAAQAAAAEAERLAPAAERQERLQRALLQAQAEAQQAQAATLRLEQERGRLAQLAERLRRVEAGLAERGRLEGERAERERELADANESLRSLRADEARENALLEQVRAQSDALARVETAQCPVCEGELTAKHRAELLERNREQIDLHARILANLGRQAAALAAQGQAAAQGLRDLQDQLALLPRPAERDALEADRLRQEDAVREAEREASRLAKAKTQAEALKAELAEVGDPRAAYQRALAVAGRQAALAADLEAQRAALAALTVHLAELESSLAAYATLDEDLAAVRAALAANEPAYQRYLQHEHEAQALPSCQAHLAELQAGLDGARGERAELERELVAARAAYRLEDYERTTAHYLQASDERSRLETRVELQRRRREEAQAWQTELQEVSRRLQAAEGDLAAWHKLGQLLEYLRKVLKEAGPQVTRALVEVISLQAARLYADIISDQTGRLRWSEDYEILLEYKGYDRPFQQLSGGEQMAAALAVRLALLREISDIDIAFFDEPTSNLDDTRRDNLADQILAIKGFSQLFVVSHDDTFERATDHVIRVAKEEGASKVVS